MDNIFEGGLRTARGHSGVEGWWGTAHGVWWCGGLRPSLGRGTRAVSHAARCSRVRVLQLQARLQKYQLCGVRTLRHSAPQFGDKMGVKTKPTRQGSPDAYEWA